jgi:hypothetical protein
MLQEIVSYVFLDIRRYCLADAPIGRPRFGLEKRPAFRQTTAVESTTPILNAHPSRVAELGAPTLSVTVADDARRETWEKRHRD